MLSMRLPTQQMSYSEQSDKLAGAIGLLKQYVIHPSLLSVHESHTVYRFITRTGRETAEDATQIFGGRGITATGMGKLVENVCPTAYVLCRS